jgi:hypothetical protein
MCPIGADGCEYTAANDEKATASILKVLEQNYQLSVPPDQATVVSLAR